jgi:hypothetical protein
MLRIKAILTAMLIIIVSGTPFMTGTSADEKPKADSATDTTITKTETAPEDSLQESTPEVVVYYFHTTRRCPSCRKIEAYSREAIETGFREELESGVMEFYAKNIDEPENKHFIGEYKLYTKSLIVTVLENGTEKEWKNLAKVWQLLRDKKAFLEYVQDEVQASLKVD